MTCAGDADFGPGLLASAVGCRDFDFTLTFERAILQILPGTLTIGIALARLYSLRGKAKLVVRVGRHQYTKGVLYAALAIVQLAVVALHASHDQEHGGGSGTLAIAGSCAAVLVTACLGVESFVEHARIPSPSLIVQIALSISLVLDAALLRTSWLVWASSSTAGSGSLLSLAALQSTVSGLKLAALIYESKDKLKNLGVQHDGTGATSAEATMGFFGRTFMAWLHPLFTLGYHKKITLEDLPHVDNDLTGHETAGRLRKAWMAAASRKQGRRLAWAVMEAFRFDLALVHVPKLGLVGCSLAQPMLIRAVLGHIQKQQQKQQDGNEQSPVPRYYGGYLVAATGLTYVLLTIMTLWSQHLTFRFLTKVRGALAGMIFKGSLTTRQSASEDNSKSHVSNDSSSSSAGAQPVTLMSAEVDRISYTLQWSLAVIPNTIQVGLGLWILHGSIGRAVVAPAAVAVICGVAAAKVGKNIPTRQGQWMKSIQKRVSITADILSQIKAVRVSGMQVAADQNVLDARDREIEQQKSFRKLQVCNIVIGNIPAMVTPAVTFSAFAIIQSLAPAGGDQFDTVLAFSSLSLLTILIAPIAELVAASINISSALTSLERIQAFLHQADLGDRACGDEHAMSLPVSYESVPPAGKVLFRMRNCSISWGPVSPASMAPGLVLCDINLDISEGDIIAIAGPVGCGKSLLLNAILGEAHLVSGQIERALPSQISYCAQNPWIPARSLRDVIVGEGEWNQRRYEEVVSACRLVNDFATIQGGDDAMARNGGSRLSGGQRQRLALARAVYHPSRLVNLDDSFSGLDSNTSREVAEALLGANGLLRAANRAVVLTSSSAIFATYANKLVVLSNGKVEVESICSAADDPSISSAQAARSLAKVEKSTAELMETTDQQQWTPQAQIRENGCVNNVTVSPSRSASSPTAISRLPNSSMTYYMSLMGHIRVVILFTLTAMLVGCLVGQTLWLKSWAAENAAQPTREPYYWTGIYVLLACLNVAAIGMETSYFFVQIVPRVARRFHASMVTILSAHMDFFSLIDTGEVLNLFASDLNLIDLPLPLSFLLTFEKAATTVAEAALTCLSSGYLAAALPIVFLAIYLTQRIYLRTSRQLRVLDLEAKAPLMTHYVESFEGRTTIRAMAWKSSVTERATKILDVSQRPYYLLFCLQRWLNLVLDLITTVLATFLVGIAVAQADRINSAIDVGYLGVGLVSMMGFGQTLGQLITHWTNLETSLGAVDRVRKFVAATPVEDNQTFERQGIELVPLSTARSGGAVVKFHNLSASRCGSEVLRDVSLCFAPGTKTAICGRTGSGKSSLLDVLLRIMTITGGTITVDNMDITRLSSDVLREKVVALPQNTLMFTGQSVRKNLDPYMSHMGDEGCRNIMSALQLVGLKELVVARGGLDVEIGTDWFSAGQAQLFGMARALLRRGEGSVFLLDEATSNLDKETSVKMYELIETHFRDWTVIIVTHQVDDVIKHNFDQVVVMKNGVVAKAGDPLALLRQDNSSEFCQLLSGQTRVQPRV